jgi:phage shock protein A
MSIFSRFRDIVSANINAILDKAEDPEKMVRLMIQEMEDTLIEVKSNCAGFMAEQKRMERQLESVQAEAEAWANKARLAVEKGRDDLARAALAEKQRHTHKVESLTEQVNQSRDLVTQTQTTSVCGTARCFRRLGAIGASGHSGRLPAFLNIANTPTTGSNNDQFDQ